MVCSLNSPKGKGSAADVKTFFNFVEEREMATSPLLLSLQSTLHSGRKIFTLLVREREGAETNGFCVE